MYSSFTIKNVTVDNSISIPGYICTVSLYINNNTDSRITDIGNNITLTYDIHSGSSGTLTSSCINDFLVMRIREKRNNKIQKILSVPLKNIILNEY